MRCTYCVAALEVICDEGTGLKTTLEHDLVGRILGHGSEQLASLCEIDDVNFRALVAKDGGESVEFSKSGEDEVDC